jgi:PGF-CTERM protein
MNTRQSVVALALAALLIVGLGSAVAVAAEYEVGAQTSTDTPNRTVTVEGSSYEVTAVGHVAFGDALDVDVTAPDGEAVEVYLYDGDRRIIDSEETTGDSTVAFETSYYEPGSYVLALYGDSDEIRAIQPVVFAGYETSIDVPADVTAGEPVDATVSLTNVTSMPAPHAVEVVVAQDDDVVSRTDAARTGDGDYEASLGSDLEAGDYTVYAMVRNQSTVDGKHELVGVSDLATLTVANASDGGQSGDQSGGGGADAGDPTETASETETETETDATTETPTETATPTTQPADQQTAATRTDDTTETTTGDSSERDTQTTDGVLTPSAGPTGTSTTSTPGFTATLAVVAWMGLALLVWRRRR